MYSKRRRNYAGIAARFSWKANSNGTRVIAKASVVIARILTYLALACEEEGGSVTDALKIRSNATDRG